MFRVGCEYYPAIIRVHLLIFEFNDPYQSIAVAAGQVPRQVVSFIMPEFAYPMHPEQPFAQEQLFCRGGVASPIQA